MHCRIGILYRIKILILFVEEHSVKKIFLELFFLGLVCFFPQTILGETFFDNLTGKIIYYPSNQVIYEFDLNTNLESVLYKPKDFFVCNFSKINSDKFLFVSGCIYDETNVIMSFDRNTAKIEKIMTGSGPFYMQSTGKLFFWRKYPHDKDTYLYMVDFDKLNSQPKRVGANFNIVGPGNFPPGIVQVSETEIVISAYYFGSVYPFKNNNKVFLYDVAKDKLSLTPIKNCSNPWFWRPSSNQLLCYNTSNNSSFFTSLDGKTGLVFKDWGIGGVDNKWEPVNYLPKYDIAVLLHITPIFEDEDAWLYDFTTGKKKRILKDGGGMRGFYVDK